MYNYKISGHSHEILNNVYTVNQIVTRQSYVIGYKAFFVLSISLCFKTFARNWHTVTYPWHIWPYKKIANAHWPEHMKLNSNYPNALYFVLFLWKQCHKIRFIQIPQDLAFSIYFRNNIFMFSHIGKNCQRFKYLNGLEVH